MTEPAADAAADSPPLPERVGAYLIQKELGSGGMGTVYLGTHAETGREAAIKVLPASMARESGFVARFDREIAAMKSLKSPNIVELYESGEDHGTYYYAMEYIAGETLIDRLHREKRIPWRETINIGVQVCRALKAAHNCGIIHRDLKPSNLLIDQNGTVKLSDFGIAQVFASSKLTVTGGILGTAEYMSPEQAQGKRTTKQSDIYSLGAVLYAMITGRPPFTGKTTLEIAQKHRFAQFDSPKRIVPDIPFWLDEIICKCLSKKIEDRYPDAYVLSLRLQEVIKKVDLKSSSTFEFDEVDATNETMVEDGHGDSARERAVSGTIARELFRAQIEAENRPTFWARLFDNVWVLLGSLCLVVGGGAAVAWINHLSPEDRFEHGAALMDEPEGPGWDIAQRDYFAPLLEQDPETWGPRIEPYSGLLQLHALKKELLGRNLQRVPVPKSEPEAVFRQVLELRSTGRLAEARAKLGALDSLLETDEQSQLLRDLAVHLDEELAREQGTLQTDFLSAALKRADRAQAAGDLRQARAIWRSVLELYDADPGAKSSVETARRHLDALPPAAGPNPPLSH